MTCHDMHATSLLFTNLRVLDTKRVDLQTFAFLVQNASTFHIASACSVGSLQTTLSEVVVDVDVVELVLVEVPVSGTNGFVPFGFVPFPPAVELEVVVVGGRQSAFLRNLGCTPNFSHFVEVGGSIGLPWPFLQTTLQLSPSRK